MILLLGTDMNKLPMADAVPYHDNVDKDKKAILHKNLTGLANNTKWNELISAVRLLQKKPSYRCKYVVNDHISTWDTEWFYHLPFPFLAVEWFDLSLDANDVDASCLVSLVSEIGFEFEVKSNILRIWGYAPKSYDEF